jgi:hypothetical protein
LHRAGRELGDGFAQRLGQAVGNHLEVIEISGLMAGEEEFENGAAGVEIQVERAIHELELLHATIQQLLHFALRNNSVFTARTGTSSDERQNSHVNGQPREAST